MNRSDPASAPAVVIRPPRPEDGGALWNLVCETPGLEANTAYFYLLFARDFAATCRVAEEDGAARGLLLGYRRPEELSTFFVWQVGVHPDAQRGGLARRMVDDVIDNADPPITAVEATVTPDNAASRGFFRSLARRRGAECAVTPLFLPDHFRPQNHEAEELFRIGPLGGAS